MTYMRLRVKGVYLGWGIAARELCAIWPLVNLAQNFWRFCKAALWPHGSSCEGAGNDAIAYIGGPP